MEGLQLKYFVLEPNKNTISGYASREAIRTYAYIVKPYNEKLSEDLLMWIDSINSEFENLKIEDV